MISKFLFLLQDGFKGVITHGRLVIVIVLLFFLPLCLLYVHSSLTQSALQNIITSDQRLVQLTHTHLRLLGTEVQGFSDTAFAIKETQSSIEEIMLFERLNGNYQLATTTGETYSIDTFILEAAPLDGDVYIFEIERTPGRVWIVTSRFGASQENVAVTVHDFQASDTLVSDRNSEAMFVIGLGYLLLLGIALWLLSQINWRSRYEDLMNRQREQQVLLHALTHEFRSPLTAIVGHISFLRESNRLRSKDKGSLDKLEKSASRLQRLVNDFLELGKIQSGSVTMNITLVTVAEAIEQVIATLGPLAAQREIVLRDGTRDSSIVLTTDQSRLVQIIHNLVNNAIKYTETGEVTVTYEKSPIQLKIRIQDNGSGISAEDQVKLFQPFVRVGGVVDTDTVGSGLGMWISKKLAEILGGAIAVESIEGVGTHVIVTFDLRKIAQKTREGIL